MGSSSTKPDWLPEDLWHNLERFTAKTRPTEPTDGFALHCASYHPDFDRDTYAEKASTNSKGASQAQIKYLYGLLDIPIVKRAEQNKGHKDR